MFRVRCCVFREFCQKPLRFKDEGYSIFFRMLAFVLLAMAPGIDHDKDENQKSDSEENHYPGAIFPNLLNSIRKLGPIHVPG